MRIPFPLEKNTNPHKDKNLSPLQKEMLQSPRYQEIEAYLEAFTKKHLNQEYFELTQKMLRGIAGSLLDINCGEAHLWAAGIMYAVATINHLEDRPSEWQMPLKNIAEYFNAPLNTVKITSDAIRNEIIFTCLTSAFNTKENSNINMSIEEARILNRNHRTPSLHYMEFEDEDYESEPIAVYSATQNDSLLNLLKQSDFTEEHLEALLSFLAPKEPDNEPSSDDEKSKQDTPTKVVPFEKKET